MLAKSAAVLALALAALASPAGTSAQRLMLQGGPVIIELDPVGAPVNEDRSSRLRWNQVRSPSKIMVSSSVSNQRFDLSVDASDVRRGTAVGEIALISGDPARDFIVGIVDRGAGSCSLVYRAEARADHGYGDEIHTVTYTITGL